MNNFVKVHWVPSEMEASIIKGKLENAGIETVINRMNINDPVHSYLLSSNVPHGIFVKEDKVEEVKKILGVK